MVLNYECLFFYENGILRFGQRYEHLKYIFIVLDCIKNGKDIYNRCNHPNTRSSNCIRKIEIVV